MMNTYIIGRMIKFINIISNLYVHCPCLLLIFIYKTKFTYYKPNMLVNIFNILKMQGELTVNPFKVNSLVLSFTTLCLLSILTVPVILKITTHFMLVFPFVYIGTLLKAHNKRNCTNQLSNELMNSLYHDLLHFCNTMKLKLNFLIEVIIAQKVLTEKIY